MGIVFFYAKKGHCNRTPRINEHTIELSNTMPKMRGGRIKVAKALYVNSTKGSNSYNGSLSQPFKTIQYAINSARAGDVIYVQNGTYKERIQLNKSGTSDSPIKLVAYPGHRPVINGTGIKWAGNGNWGGLINFNRQSHWFFEGIHLENAYGMGFGDDYQEPTTVGSRNIQVKNCSVTKAGGSGFFVEFAEDILIDNFIAKETNKNLGQEGISLLNVNRFEIKNCQVLDCYKEGIDVKDGCKNGTIHDCYVNNTVRVGIYVDAFSRDSSNIQVYDNIATVPNGAGFSTAAEAGGKLENILFRNNIVYDSLRGYNISSNNSETNLPYMMKNITLQNNIAFNSGFTGIFIVAKVANLLIENNILYPSLSHLSNCIFVYDLKMYDANTAIIRNNLLAAINTNKNVIRGIDYIVEAKYNSVMIDPTGVLTGTRNFGLTKNSIARNAGYQGVDMGHI